MSTTLRQTVEGYLAGVSEKEKLFFPWLIIYKDKVYGAYKTSTAASYGAIRKAHLVGYENWKEHGALINAHQELGQPTSVRGEA